MPFCYFLSGGQEALGGILLTVVGERGVGVEGAQLLARYIPDPEDTSLDPALGERLKSLLKDWQR